MNRKKLLILALSILIAQLAIGVLAAGALKAPPQAQTAAASLSVNAHCTASGNQVTCTGVSAGGVGSSTITWSTSAGGTITANADQSVTITFDTGGTHTVTITAVDTSGLKISKDIMVTTGPMEDETVDIDVDCGTGVVKAGDSVTCTATSTGGEAPITIRWSAPEGTVKAKSTTGPESTFTTTFNTPGHHTITVTASDRDNEKSMERVTLNVEGEGPPEQEGFEVHISCPATKNVGETVKCSATSTHAQGTVMFTWTAPGSTNAAGTGSRFNTTYTTAGRVRIILSGTDSAGNTDNATAHIRITTPVLPALKIHSECPSKVVVGANVHCTATTSGGQGSVTIQWSARGATKTNDTGPNFDTSFTTPGRREIKATATDQAGNTGSHTEVVQVASAPQPIVLTLTCPSTGIIGQQVKCSVNGTGGQGSLSFTWTAGGGTPSSGRHASFTTTFNSTGTKTITVTGTDKGGASATANATVTVTVQPPSEALRLISFKSSTGTIRAGQEVTFTASFVGGTGPFTCVFTFTISTNTNAGGSDRGGGHGHEHHGGHGQGETGEDDHAPDGSGGSDPSCSTTQTFRHPGKLAATIQVIGQNNEQVTGTLNTTIRPSTSGGGNCDNGASSGVNCCDCCCCKSARSRENSDP